MENPPFEDVFPIQDGDFPLLCLFTGGCNNGPPKCCKWIYIYISLVTPTDNWGSVAHGRIFSSDHLPRFVFCEGIDASGRILQSFLVIVIYTVDISRYS